MEQSNLYHAKTLFCKPLWCLLNKLVNVMKHKEATVILVTLTWHLVDENRVARYIKEKLKATKSYCNHNKYSENYN